MRLCDVAQETFVLQAEAQQSFELLTNDMDQFRGQANDLATGM